MRYGIRILATNEKSNCEYWRTHVTLYQDYLDDLAGIWRTGKEDSLWFSLKWGLKLFITSRDYEVVVTTADRSSMVFSFLQLLIRRRRKPHILVIVLWNLPRIRILRFFRWIEYKIILKSVSKVIVFSKRQQHLHVVAFREQVNKFPVIYYHTTLGDVQLAIQDGGYFFAGGDTGRDYRTLIEAIRNLPFKLVIAALHRHHFYGVDMPDNVTIVTVDSNGFLGLIAGCKAMVVPLFAGKLQAGGHQTFLNGMAMGKTVIVADDNGAEEYIENGVDGFVIPPGNVAEMRRAIHKVGSKPGLCIEIGEKAKKKAANYSVTKFTRDLYNISCGLVTENYV